MTFTKNITAGNNGKVDIDHSKTRYIEIYVSTVITFLIHQINFHNTYNLHINNALQYAILKYLKKFTGASHCTLRYTQRVS